MITRLAVKGYKSLKDIQVRLSPLTVLFGPNSAGKSNFLDAIQLLARVATAKHIKEAFQPPYRGTPVESFSFGDGGMEELLRQDHASLTIEADIALADDVVKAVERRIDEFQKAKERHTESTTKAKVREKFLRYRVVLEVRPESGIIHVVDEYLAALNQHGELKNNRKPFIERVSTERQTRLHLRMEGQAHPTYFEVCLPHTVLSMPHHPPHYPHLEAVRTEMERWQLFYFEPRERMRQVSPIKEVHHIGLMGEDLAPFLNTLRATDTRRFQSVRRGLRTILPLVTDLIVAPNNKGEVELSIIEDGCTIPSRLLSEGTLRIIGLLALASGVEPPAVIGFEEPENGIHPRRMALVARLLEALAAPGRSQVIVTTHSPLLPDLVPDDSLRTVKRVDGATMIEDFSTWGQIGRTSDIVKGLDDGEEPVGSSVVERLLRGDFDG